MCSRLGLIFLTVCTLILCSWHVPSSGSVEDQTGTIAARVQSVQQKADSIVILFYGEENFKNHIQLYKQYCAFRFGMYDWSGVKFTDTLVPARLPYAYHYYYSIRFPASGCCDEITFDLDSLGNLIWDNKTFHTTKTKGLSSSTINIDFNKIIDSTTALDIARKHGMKKKLYVQRVLPGTMQTGKPSPDVPIR